MRLIIDGDGSPVKMKLLSLVKNFLYQLLSLQALTTLQQKITLILLNLFMWTKVLMGRIIVLLRR